LSLLSPIAGYTDSSLSGPVGLAFDLSGNLWIANQNGHHLTEYSSSGSYMKTVTGGGLSGPEYVAVDKSNNIWVSNLGSHYEGLTYITANAGASELTNAGVAISPAGGYTGGGVGYYSNSLAIDTNGNAWVSGAYGLAELGPGGTPISPSSGFGPDEDSGIAIDGSGNVWTVPSSTSLEAYRSNGQVFSPAGGFTGGGQQGHSRVVVDGANHIWTGNANFGTPAHVGALSEFTNTGVAVSPATGYATEGDGSLALAIDSSGNVWWPGIGTLAKCVGVAVPVVTPLSVATANGQLGALP
jgi:hypothetical protein